MFFVLFSDHAGLDCPPYRGTCQISCSNLAAPSECIPCDWACDGHPDCLNGYDETEASCKGGE